MNDQYFYTNLAFLSRIKVNCLNIRYNYFSDFFLFFLQIFGIIRSKTKNHAIFYQRPFILFHNKSESWFLFYQAFAEEIEKTVSLHSVITDREFFFMYINNKIKLLCKRLKDIRIDVDKRAA